METKKNTRTGDTVSSNDSSCLLVANDIRHSAYSGVSPWYTVTCLCLCCDWCAAGNRQRGESTGLGGKRPGLCSLTWYQASPRLGPAPLPCLCFHFHFHCWSSLQTMYKSFFFFFFNLKLIEDWHKQQAWSCDKPQHSWIRHTRWQPAGKVLPGALPGLGHKTQNQGTWGPFWS